MCVRGGTGPAGQKNGKGARQKKGWERGKGKYTGGAGHAGLPPLRHERCADESGSCSEAGPEDRQPVSLTDG